MFSVFDYVDYSNFLGPWIGVPDMCRKLPPELDDRPCRNWAGKGGEEIIGTQLYVYYSCKFSICC